MGDLDALNSAPSGCPSTGLNSPVDSHVKPCAVKNIIFPEPPKKAKLKVQISLPLIGGLDWWVDGSETHLPSKSAEVKGMGTAQRPF